eukprot:TRINITY_DN6663_c0_g1_i3.p1 TRINITY_DN6663_c0_g1~~TRINITY_DN6663_c0_g1_i3.p1  ORF type:complete len:467 (+),score=95.92 TRINITY_DN6663_c0_g1_i3:88-1488(+)
MSAVDLSQFTGFMSKFESLVNRLEVATGKLDDGPSGAATSTVTVAPPIAIAFDAYMTAHMAPVQAAAKEAGVKDITEGTDMIVKAFGFARDLLVGTATCRKPQDADWAKFLGPVMDLGKAAQKVCDNRSEYFQNRKVVAELVNVVMFVTSPAPSAHVQNVMESMDFHAIKVMQKKIDKETVWVKALKAAVKAFQDWCAENCKLGVTWNPKGEAASEYFAANPLGSSKESATTTAAASQSGGPSVGQMFSGLQGFDTSTLKKVTPEMKSKNQVKEAGSSVVPAAKEKTPPPAAFASGRHVKGPKGPPRLELEKDKNWMVENYDGVSDLKVADVEVGQLVVIINCKNTTVHITSPKVKSVCIDGCVKVNVICRDVLSCVEVVNSDRIQMQTTGVVRSVSIDKCNGVHLFLSKESMHAEITSSKSSEMNITVPDVDGEDGDQIELPVPEQFVTRLVGKRLQSEVSSLYS